MGREWELAKEFAELAQELGKGFVLIVRKDGTFQMSMTDPINSDDLPAGAEEAITTQKRNCIVA